jgi:hypothetical protein
MRVPHPSSDLARVPHFSRLLREVGVLILIAPRPKHRRFHRKKNVIRVKCRIPNANCQLLIANCELLYLC